MTLSAGEIARLVGGELEGNPNVSLQNANSLEAAQHFDLAFVSEARWFAAAERSKAGCILAPPYYQPPHGQTVIRSSAPRAAFARVLAALLPTMPITPGVHPSSVCDPTSTVDPSAEVGPLCSIGVRSRIGANTRIGAGCHIHEDVSIGSSCVLYCGVAIYRGVRIGDRAVLHAGCVIGADGFGFAPVNGAWVKFPQAGSVQIGDDVEIGAQSCVDRAALGVTRIGDGVKIDNLVHVGHNCDIGAHVVIAAQTGLSGGVVVGAGAVIGGQVGVGDKARIEAGAVIGSGSGVLSSKVVRAGEPQWGTPARPLREYLAQLAWVRRQFRRGAAKERTE